MASGWPSSAEVHAAVGARVTQLLDECGGVVAEMGRLHILDTLASIVACRDLDAAVLGRKYAAMKSGTARRNTDWKRRPGTCRNA